MHSMDNHASIWAANYFHPILSLAILATTACATEDESFLFIIKFFLIFCNYMSVVVSMVICKIFTMFSQLRKFCYYIIVG